MRRQLTKSTFAVLSPVLIFLGVAAQTRRVPDEAPQGIPLTTLARHVAEAPSVDFNLLVLQYCVVCHNDVAQTGNRVFFVNQEGDLMQMNNRIAVPYSGVVAVPAFDAAHTIIGDMASPVAIGVAGADGNTWVTVQ